MQVLSKAGRRDCDCSEASGPGVRRYKIVFSLALMLTLYRRQKTRLGDHMDRYSERKRLLISVVSNT